MTQFSGVSFYPPWVTVIPSSFLDISTKGKKYS